MGDTIYSEQNSFICDPIGPINMNVDVMKIGEMGKHANTSI